MKFYNEKTKETKTAKELLEMKYSNSKDVFMGMDLVTGEITTEFLDGGGESFAGAFPGWELVDEPVSKTETVDKASEKNNGVDLLSEVISLFLLFEKTEKEKTDLLNFNIIRISYELIAKMYNEGKSFNLGILDELKKHGYLEPVSSETETVETDRIKEIIIEPAYVTTGEFNDAMMRIDERLIGIREIISINHRGSKERDENLEKRIAELEKPQPEETESERLTRLINENKGYYLESNYKYIFEGDVNSDRYGICRLSPSGLKEDYVFPGVWEIVKPTEWIELEIIKHYRQDSVKCPIYSDLASIKNCLDCKDCDSILFKKNKVRCLFKQEDKDDNIETVKKVAETIKKQPENIKVESATQYSPEDDESDDEDFNNITLKSYPNSKKRLDTKIISAKQVCVKCDKEIPEGTRFCEECSHLR